MKRQLQVDFVDFAVTAILFEPVFVESLHHGDERNLETSAQIEWISNQKNNAPVSAAELSRRLNISKDNAYALLRRAERAGVIRRVNKPEKGNRKLFLPTPRPRFLPDSEQLFRQIPELPEAVRFIHPLTDEWVVYRKHRHKEGS